MKTTEAIKMTVQELVEAVAEEVMGWERMCSEGFGDSFGFYKDGKRQAEDANDYKPHERPHPRDDIVERMRELGYDTRIIILKPPARPVVQFNEVARVNKNLGIAVMLAAYEAITGKRVEVTREN